MYSNSPFGRPVHSAEEIIASMAPERVNELAMQSVIGHQMLWREVRTMQSKIDELQSDVDDLHIQLSIARHQTSEVDRFSVKVVSYDYESIRKAKFDLNDEFLLCYRALARSYKRGRARRGLTW